MHVACVVGAGWTLHAATYASGQTDAEPPQACTQILRSGIGNKEQAAFTLPIRAQALRTLARSASALAEHAPTVYEQVQMTLIRAYQTPESGLGSAFLFLGKPGEAPRHDFQGESLRCTVCYAT